MDELPTSPLGRVNVANVNPTPARAAVHIGNFDSTVVVNIGYDTDVAVIASLRNKDGAVARGSVDGIAARGELTRPIAGVTETARERVVVVIAPLPSVPSTPTIRHRVATG